MKRRGGSSSQDLVETLPARLVDGFEMLWTETIELAVTSRSPIEGIDKVADCGDSLAKSFEARLFVWC